MAISYRCYEPQQVLFVFVDRRTGKPRESLINSPPQAREVRV
jgi:hypothetical protein